ncbi:hypothetical protein BJ878DRAFT_509532, partial [Calycina marina]
MEAAKILTLSVNCKEIQVLLPVKPTYIKHLVDNIRYIGFVAEMNSSNGSILNRPTMEACWHTYIKDCLLASRKQNTYSAEDLNELLMSALSQMIDENAEDYWTTQAATVQSQYGNALTIESSSDWAADPLSMKCIVNNAVGMGESAHPFDGELQITAELVEEQNRLFNEARGHNFETRAIVSQDPTKRALATDVDAEVKAEMERRHQIRGIDENYGDEDEDM